jgi:hypothetical protein|nr:MAG TPA: hypothetical protein [Caudoviricetes sp.]
MMERDAAIASITKSVMAMCGIKDGTEDSDRIDAFASQYYDMAAGITGYAELLDAHLPFVTTATMRAWRKRGAEANRSFSGIGVSESYVDIENDLLNAVKGMKNPFATVITEIGNA